MDAFGSPWPSPRGGLDDGLQMETLAELHDGAFEPQTRARSNTWPLPRPDNYVEPHDDTGSNKCSNQQLTGVGGQPITSPNVAQSKKNSSRRNAWGNLSYADLITQAISSAADSRLTLSQIYEWMVTNVPYFKDKGDSNSSAGWKNSIRHNLSLHNRFMRVQNEGTGKSSWWMLNPDAKPGKSVRRRAASMETSKYEKRRGRAKKRVEALRNAQALGINGITGVLNDATPSPSSSVSEGLDLFPDSPLHSGGFQLSPDFRQRASSNASSCGRLSPIPSILGLEPDWSFTSSQQQQQQQQQQDGNNGSGNGSGNTTGNGADESGECGGGGRSSGGSVNATGGGGGGTSGGGGGGGGGGSSALSISASLDQLERSLADDLTLPNEFLQGFSTATTIHTQPPPSYQPPQPYSLHAATVVQSYVLQHQTHQCPMHRLQPCACMHQTNTRESMSPASGTGMSPSYPHSEASPDPMGSYNSIGLGGTRHIQRPPSNSPPLTPSSIGGSCNNGIDGTDATPSTLMGQFMEVLNNQTLIEDHNLNIEDFQGGLDCNVDEVIKHELSMDGLLDFNFPIPHHHHTAQGNHGMGENVQSALGSAPGQGGPSHAPPVQYQARTSVTPPSWVH